MGFFMNRLMNLLNQFQQHCTTRFARMCDSNHVSLLAVSGGIDSVVLCHLFNKLGYNFLIAHCNFQLRGEESRRDEQFVKQLADKYGKQLFVKQFETNKYVEENKVSVQVAARDLRYAWFRLLAFEEKQADSIVTAHHADDNIETVVMNFFRGTGLKGLTGMDDEYNKILRPLLPFRKKDLIEYANENGLTFVEDSSNISSNYTRNYFRNDLLPSVQKVFPEAEENILKNIERLREVQQVYNNAIIEHKKKLIEHKGDEEHIPILKLQKLTSFRTVLWEIIKEKSYTAGQVDEVIKLMNADNGSYINSPSHTIIKNRKWLIITPKHAEESNNVIAIDEAVRKVKFSDKQLSIEHVAQPNIQISTSTNVACVDAQNITFPLLLRKAKQGDYFYPLGMKKKKKISRFLIDQKLSKTEKENVWVLETNKKIIWVVGYRIDERFKIQPTTKSALKISLSN